MFNQASKVHFDIAAGNVRRVAMDTALDWIKSDPNAMQKLGFSVPRSVAMDMARNYGFAMDSIQGDVTTPSIPGLVQFLQSWYPGQIYVMTADRAIDRLIGITTMGEWKDEQLVASVLEQSGYPRPYSDDANTPLANWNQTYVPRTIVRLELGAEVGILEEERSAAMRVNSGQAKRESCGENLEISRNLIGFNGYNSGNNNTYGFLNDPGLLPIITVANGATGFPEWSTKTFLEIQQDLLTFFNQLLIQTKGRVDPMQQETVLALPQNAVTYLARTSDFGISVKKWLTDTYPKCRVENAIQLNTAGGNSVGNGIAYLYAERVNDSSTDDGKVWVQGVPMKFRVLGVQKLVKSVLESYSNATAGSFCKRPVAVCRFEGIS